MPLAPPPEPVPAPAGPPVRHHRAPRGAAAGGALPDGLDVVEHPPSSGWDGYGGPIVVLVHGSLDRAASFGRVVRRLPEWAVVTYDRRGYQSSRAAGVARGLDGHVDDLVAVAAAYGGLGPVSAVGHSVGGTVVLGAAVREPARFASVGAYEPSMPWLGFYPARPGHGPGALDPAAEVERFFRRMVGDGAWERLTEHRRASLVGDGPALVAELAAVRAGVAYDVTTLQVPAVIGVGGPGSFRHHVETARWVADHVPGAHLEVIADAAHGAHLSHPDAFARLVRDTVAISHRVAANGGVQ